MSNLFTCNDSGYGLCLECESCKIKALALKDEVDKLEDRNCRMFIQRRYLDKKSYKSIMEEFDTVKLYEVKYKIRLGRQSINLKTIPILDDILKRYKREENLKALLP